MRNRALWFVLLVALIFCKTGVLSAQTDASAIRGNWEITEISSPVENMFGIADSKCFISSTWKFLADKKGSLTLNASGCPSFSSEIEWNTNKEGGIVLKIIGAKSKTAAAGITFKVANQTSDSFQLIEVIKADGQNKEIVYQFEKIFEFQ